MFIDDYNQPVKLPIRFKAAEKRVPIEGAFELTPQCTMACKMCYIVMNKQQIKESGKRERTAAEWLNLAEQCCNEGMLYLLLTGGEAMYRKDFREIYEGLAAMGLNIRLNSNGTLFTPDNLSWLVKHPPNRVNITLYGSNNQTYERLCGLKNGFDIVKKAIFDLLEAKIEVKINSTITPYNKNDLEDIINFTKDYNLRSQIVNYTFPTRRRDCDNAKTERFDVLKAAESELFTRCKKNDGFIEFAYKNLKDNQAKICNEPFAMNCLAGKSMFWVTWDGKLTPCCLMDNIYADPFEEGFAAAWKKVTEETEKIYYPKECWDCKYKYNCFSCPGIHYSETGAMNKRGDYICDFVKQYYRLIEERSNINEK